MESKKIRFKELISIENTPVSLFDGTKKYYSTGDYDSDNYELITFDNRPSRANLALKEGQITLAKMKSTEKIKIVTKEMEDNVYSTGLFAIRPVGIKTEYLYYVMSSPEFLQEKDSLSFGTTQPSINEEKLNTISVTIVNDAQKQIDISNHLDKKIEIIDSLINVENKQIDKLNDYRMAIIEKTTRNGITKKEKHISTKIERIGSIPEDWKLLPFGRILSERSEKNNPVKSEERLSLSIGLGVTLYAEKTTNLDRFKDDFTQYKLAYPGDLVMNSMNMIVGATGVSSYFGCVSPAYYTFYNSNKDHHKTKFLEYVFKTKTMMRYLHSLGKGIYSIDRGDDKVNTCRLKVARNDLKNILIPLPPDDEIRKIVDFLNNKNDKIDELIKLKMNKIKILLDYKKSLIYEYVTGKKEVC